MIPLPTSNLKKEARPILEAVSNQPSAEEWDRTLIPRPQLYPLQRRMKALGLPYWGTVVWAESKLIKAKKMMIFITWEKTQSSRRKLLKTRGFLFHRR